MRHFVAVALFLAACHHGTSSPTPPDPTPGSDNSGSAAAEPPSFGEKCLSAGNAARCATGLECVEYFGIAGPKGPKFESCEIRCTPDKGCPDGKTCRTIADGPGQVCR